MLKTVRESYKRNLLNNSMFAAFLQLRVHFTRYMRRSNVDKIKIIAHLSESLITGDETNRYKIIFQMNELKNGCWSILQVNTLTHSSIIISAIVKFGDYKSANYTAKISIKIVKSTCFWHIFVLCFVFVRAFVSIILDWKMSALRFY